MCILILCVHKWWNWIWNLYPPPLIVHVFLSLPPDVVNFFLLLSIFSNLNLNFLCVSWRYDYDGDMDFQDTSEKVCHGAYFRRHLALQISRNVTSIAVHRTIFRFHSCRRDLIRNTIRSYYQTLMLPHWHNHNSQKTKSIQT